jgi:putative ABC transport system ATP-binding protein
MLHLEGVHKHFGAGASRVDALRGLDLNIPKGQMCAIMGPSGAGKSTVLHLAAGLVRPDKGLVKIGGRELSSLSDDELTLFRRREIGIVFQFFNLLPYLTAYENIALPLRLDNVSATEERGRVMETLQVVGLEHRSDHKPFELSGGELQRVAVARAIAIRPTVLLADEPTGNLDSVAGRQIMNLLSDVSQRTDLTTLIVTHDAVWASVCDRVVRMIDGRVDQDIPVANRGAGDGRRSLGN